MVCGGPAELFFTGKQSLETLLGVEYNDGCWAVRLVGQRYQKDLNTSTTAFYLQLELNGLAALAAIRCKPCARASLVIARSTTFPENSDEKSADCRPVCHRLAQAGAAVREADRIVAAVNKDVITEVGLRQRMAEAQAMLKNRMYRCRRPRCCALQVFEQMVTESVQLAIRRADRAAPGRRRAGAHTDPHCRKQQAQPGSFP